MPIIRDLTGLNPKFKGVIVRLHDYLVDSHETGRTKTRFEIFETIRSPARQADLIKKGVSKAGPWQSPHQFGLAVDFVPYLTGVEATDLGNRIGEKVLPGWSWHSSHDYAFLHQAAEKFGLDNSISWDPCHVQHPQWQLVRKLWRSQFE